ncbi:MAG: YcaO-like family protein, partial [Deltaproteobacteria bacterium]|nr:YcaO-like family protein [Deltaproteobacteria bacterium]
LCEVVERHVSSIVSRNKRVTPGIEPHTATDSLVLEMLDKYHRNGIRLFVNDFSLDTGIPSIGVLAYDPSTFPERSEIVWTAGTTPHPQKALSRALTEVAQLAGDFNSSSNYVASGLPKFNRLEEADFVTRSKISTDITALPDLSDNNMRVKLENCISALSRIGLEVMVVDITHHQLNIPAFYTIIPGAHFRERAAGTSVGMFSAKLIAESEDTEWAIARLAGMDGLMPGKYYIKFFLGSCYLKKGEAPEALKMFEAALDLKPKEEDIPSIYSHMGLCYRDMSEFRKAIAILEEAERFDDERTDIYNLMGFCYFKLKEHEKAIECFRKVLRLNPGSAIDYANIASNYRDMGDREKAVRYYRLAIELDPTIDFARENLMKLEGK